jgi:alpha-beta hydrolase superfamily lysophospholipase
LQAGLAIDVPVLVMASGTSVRPSRKADLTAGDAVLNVEHMVRWAPRLGEQVTVVRIEGGLHDLVLSAAPVRERVFKELTTWLGTTGLA